MQPKAVRWLIVAAALLVVVEVLLYQSWGRIGDNRPPPSVEQQFAVAAVLSLCALPHLIARIARRRPRLLVVAAGCAFVLGAMSLVSLPLMLFAIPVFLIPGAIYLMRAGPADQQTPPAAVVGFGCAVLCVAGVAAFFLTEDPRCTILVSETAFASTNGNTLVMR